MHVTWTVSPVGYQRIAKRCPTCHIKRDFIPSGMFRMNSQKKLLDIWLIYKCIYCDATWNISLFSRIPVSRMDRQLYARIAVNDKRAILHFAHDRQTLKRNHAELSGTPDFSVREQWHATIARSPAIKVRITLTHAFQVSLLSILKKQLRLSSREIARCIDAGEIRGVTRRELRTRKFTSMAYVLHISSNAFYAARKIKGGWV